MSDDLIAAHRDEAKLMPYPAPAVPGRRRPHPRRHEPQAHGAPNTWRLVDRIRAARPDIALSTDFIVGFPGETDAEFEATLELLERVGFAQAYSFKYSPRPGTPAASLEQVPEDVRSSG